MFVPGSYQPQVCSQVKLDLIGDREILIRWLAQRELEIGKGKRAISWSLYLPYHISPSVREANAVEAYWKPLNTASFILCIR